MFPVRCYTNQKEKKAQNCLPAGNDFRVMLTLYSLVTKDKWYNEEVNRKIVNSILNSGSGGHTMMNF